MIDEADRCFDELAEVIGSRGSREDICCRWLPESIIDKGS